MFILSINTRDDSSMIDSSEIKNLDNRSDEYFQVNFFLLCCYAWVINLPQMLSFFVCFFFFLFFSAYLSRDTFSPYHQSHTPSGTKG